MTEIATCQTYENKISSHVGCINSRCNDRNKFQILKKKVQRKCRWDKTMF